MVQINNQYTPLIIIYVLGHHLTNNDHNNHDMISPGAMDLEKWAACQSEEQDRSAHQEGDDIDCGEDIV